MIILHTMVQILNADSHTPDKHRWMPEWISEVLFGEDHLCAKRQYPKMTRDSRDVAEAIVMISRMKESYLACAAKASRPVQA